MKPFCQYFSRSERTYLQSLVIRGGGVIIHISQLPAMPTHPAVPMAYRNTFHLHRTPIKLKFKKNIEPHTLPLGSDLIHLTNPAVQLLTKELK